MPYERHKAWAEAVEISDFGRVKEGETVEHVFLVQNESNAPISVTQSAASCGCTVVVPTSESITAGSTGDITVRMNTKGRSGNVASSIVVSLSDGTTREFRLTGYVYNTKLPTLKFGTIDSKAGRTKSVQFRWPQVSDFAIEKLEFDSRAIDASFENNSSERSTQITVSTLPEIGSGAFSQVIKLTSNDPEQREYVLTATGYVLHPIEVERDVIAVGNVSHNTPTWVKAVLRAPFGGLPSVKNITYVKGKSGLWRTNKVGESTLELEFELHPPGEGDEVAIAIINIEASLADYTRTMSIEAVGIVHDEFSPAEPVD